jgi:histidine triad (HIT) family protein
MYILTPVCLLLCGAVWACADVCAFCDLQVIGQQLVYETEEMMVLYNYRPICHEHYLVCPKRHVVRFEDLTAGEMVGIHSVVQKVHAAVHAVFGHTDYVLLNKNGPNAGQSVPHVHFHYMAAPGSLPVYFLRNYWRMLGAPLNGEEIHHRTARVALWLREHK